MMKKLDVTWDGVYDKTGYLFSLAKSLCCAIKNSPWPEYADDLIATSGFAFRMWVAEDLCPSATSIWEFAKQPQWVANGGVTCSYVGRYWGEDDLEEPRRLEAIGLIQTSIDHGVPAVAWDIGVCEWGLITGYDEDTQTFAVLGVTGEGEMPYALLGKRELPLLSVLTFTGTSGKSQDEIFHETLEMAVHHLSGGEWCDNAKGLAAYPALIRHFEADFKPEVSWNMDYYLGTFGALKYYAWKYFAKMHEEQLAGLYKAVYDAWLEAYQIKTGGDISIKETREKIALRLKAAHQHEVEAVERMSAILTLQG